MPEKVTTTSAYIAGAGTAAAGGATFLGMGHEEWSLFAILAGVGLSVATFMLNAWFQWDRRKWDRRQVDRRKADK